jgi:hypothetical protein
MPSRNGRRAGQKEFNAYGLFGIFDPGQAAANGQNPFHSGSARANCEKLLYLFFKLFRGQSPVFLSRFESSSLGFFSLMVVGNYGAERGGGVVGDGGEVVLWGSLNSLRAPGKRSSRAKPGETGPISRAAVRKRERGFLKATGPGRRCESWRMERFLCGASSGERHRQYITKAVR